jgi:hypothetical protein
MRLKFGLRVAAIVALASACVGGVRSEEWDAMRKLPIHDAAPPGSERLGRSTHAPRLVRVPGLGSGEGWFETVYASPWPPDETFRWYSEQFAERYRMRTINRPDVLEIQGRLEAGVTITVEVLTKPPPYGNIGVSGTLRPGPDWTKSYVFIWASTS